MRKHFYLFALTIFIIFVPNVWSKTASGIITMEFDLSDHDTGKDVQLWIPYPVTNKYQDITNVKIEGDYAEAAVYTDRTFQTPMLYARWGNDAQNRKLNFSFTVKRQEVIKRDFPVQEVPWDPSDYALYLAPTRLGPIDGEVKKLADKITAGQTSVLDKARAVYDWTIENTYRDPETRGCGIGDVYALLKEPGGKCVDISSIYVALARAAGVPAREILGIRQGKKPVEDISEWQHCWAEFYLPGYGWVPVDPADVRKMMLKQNLTLSDPKTSAYREYSCRGKQFL